MTKQFIICKNDSPKFSLPFGTTEARTTKADVRKIMNIDEVIAKCEEHDNVDDQIGTLEAVIVLLWKYAESRFDTPNDVLIELENLVKERLGE